MSGRAKHPGEKAATGKVAAFFDVDGTLLTVQSGLLYIRNLHRNGLIGTADLLRIFWGYLTYRVGMMNVARLAEVTSRWLRGRTEQSVLDHSEQWYADEVQDRYCAVMLDALEDHRARGHEVALLTSGTRYLTDWVCRDLELDHALATRVEVRDGLFTGEAVLPFCFGKGKVHWARLFAEEHGVSLADSYFYTDSIVDLPMLEAVGHPVVVNPDARLRAEANKRGWPIIESTEERTPRAVGEAA